MNKHSKQNKIKRSLSFQVTAFLILSAFLFQTSGWSQSVSLIPQAVESAIEISSAYSLSIPAELGSIQEQYQASETSPLIIAIQDAHAIWDAQNHIQSLIHYLQQNFNVSLVALEGAKGKLDPTLFTAFPDPFVKRKVFSKYLERGELSGADMAALFPAHQGSETEAAHGPHYYGIEDWGLYEANYLAYLAAVEAKAEIVKKLKEIELKLDLERVKIYSVKLNDFHEKVEAFQEERSQLVELLRYLTKEFDLSLKNRPHLAALMRSLSNNSARQKEELDIALRKMADAFQKKYRFQLGKKEQAEFQRKYQDYATGAIDSGDFLKNLIKTGQSIGVKPRLTPLMKELLGRYETLSMIKGTKLFDELKAALDEIEHSLISKPEEKMLAEKYKKTHFLKDLASLELTRDQLDEFLKAPASFLSLLKSSDGAEQTTVNLLAPAIKFYDLALKRDQAFHRNLTALMKKDKAKVAIVITGGFHSRGFEENFKKSGVSYAVIAPKISSLQGQMDYQNVMQGNLSYKSYLKTTFYDGFARHATIELVKELNEPDFRKNLKLWRDGILRALAREGRMTHASDYTRYIDSLLRIYYEKYGDEGAAVSRDQMLNAIREELGRFQKNAADSVWLEFQNQFKRFKNGLHSMRDRRALTAENISGLLDHVGQAKPAALAQLANAALTDAPVFDWMKEGRLRRSELREEYSTGQVIEDLSRTVPERKPGPMLLSSTLAALRVSRPLDLIDVMDDLNQAMKETPLDSDAEREAYGGLFEKINSALPPDLQSMLGDILNRSELVSRNGRRPVDFYSETPEAVLHGLALALLNKTASEQELEKLEEVIVSYNHLQAQKETNKAGLLSVPLLFLLTLSVYFVNPRAIKAYIRLSTQLQKLPGRYKYEAVSLNLLFTGMHIKFTDGFNALDLADIQSVLPDIKTAIRWINDVNISLPVREKLKFSLMQLFLGLTLGLQQFEEGYFPDNIDNLSGVKKSHKAVVDELESVIKENREDIVRWVQEIRDADKKHDISLAGLSWDFFTGFYELASSHNHPVDQVLSEPYKEEHREILKNFFKGITESIRPGVYSVSTPSQYRVDYIPEWESSKYEDLLQLRVLSASGRSETRMKDLTKQMALQKKRLEGALTAEIRIEAAQALARIFATAAGKIADLLTVMWKSGSTKEMIRAESDLDPAHRIVLRSFEALQKALTDELDLAVLEEVVQALGQMGVDLDATLKVLNAGLTDSHEQFRWGMIEAMDKFGDVLLLLVSVLIRVTLVNQNVLVRQAASQSSRHTIPSLEILFTAFKNTAERDSSLKVRKIASESLAEKIEWTNRALKALGAEAKTSGQKKLGLLLIHRIRSLLPPPPLRSEIREKASDGTSGEIGNLIQIWDREGLKPLESPHWLGPLLREITLKKNGGKPLEEIHVDSKLGILLAPVDPSIDPGSQTATNRQQILDALEQRGIGPNDYIYGTVFHNDSVWKETHVTMMVAKKWVFTEGWYEFFKRQNSLLDYEIFESNQDDTLLFYDLSVKEPRGNAAGTIMVDTLGIYRGFQGQKHGGKSLFRHGFENFVSLLRSEFGEENYELRISFANPRLRNMFRDYFPDMKPAAEGDVNNPSERSDEMLMWQPQVYEMRLSTPDSWNEIGAEPSALSRSEARALAPEDRAFIQALRNLNPEAPEGYQILHQIRGLLFHPDLLRKVSSLRPESIKLPALRKKILIDQNNLRNQGVEANSVEVWMNILNGEKKDRELKIYLLASLRSKRFIRFLRKISTEEQEAPLDLDVSRARLTLRIQTVRKTQREIRDAIESLASFQSVMSKEIATGLLKELAEEGYAQMIRDEMEKFLLDQPEAARFRLQEFISSSDLLKIDEEAGRTARAEMRIKKTVSDDYASFADQKQIGQKLLEQLFPVQYNQPSYKPSFSGVNNQPNNSMLAPISQEVILKGIGNLVKNSVVIAAGTRIVNMFRNVWPKAFRRFAPNSDFIIYFKFVDNIINYLIIVNKFLQGALTIQANRIISDSAKQPQDKGVKLVAEMEFAKALGVSRSGISLNLRTFSGNGIRLAKKQGLRSGIPQQDISQSSEARAEIRIAPFAKFIGLDTPEKIRGRLIQGVSQANSRHIMRESYETGRFNVRQIKGLIAEAGDKIALSLESLSTSEAIRERVWSREFPEFVKQAVKEIPVSEFYLDSLILRLRAATLGLTEETATAVVTAVRVDQRKMKGFENAIHSLIEMGKAKNHKFAFGFNVETPAELKEIASALEDMAQSLFERTIILAEAGTGIGRKDLTAVFPMLRFGTYERRNAENVLENVLKEEKKLSDPGFVWNGSGMDFGRKEILDMNLIVGRISEIGDSSLRRQAYRALAILFFLRKYRSEVWAKLKENPKGFAAFLGKYQLEILDQSFQINRNGFLAFDPDQFVASFAAGRAVQTAA